MDPVAKVERRRACDMIFWMVANGKLYKLRNRGMMVMAEVKIRKKRVIVGKELSQKVR